MSATEKLAKGINTSQAEPKEPMALVHVSRQESPNCSQREGHVPTKAAIPCRRAVHAGRALSGQGCGDRGAPGGAATEGTHTPPDLCEAEPLCFPNGVSEMTQEVKQGVTCLLWPTSAQVPCSQTVLPQSMGQRFGNLF